MPFNCQSHTFSLVTAFKLLKHTVHSTSNKISSYYSNPLICNLHPSLILTLLSLLDKGGYQEACSCSPHPVKHYLGIGPDGSPMRCLQRRNESRGCLCHHPTLHRCSHVILCPQHPRVHSQTSVVSFLQFPIQST